MQGGGLWALQWEWMESWALLGAGGEEVTGNHSFQTLILFIFIIISFIYSFMHTSNVVAETKINRYDFLALVPPVGYSESLHQCFTSIVLKLNV